MNVSVGLTLSSMDSGKIPPQFEPKFTFRDGSRNYSYDDIFDENAFAFVETCVQAGVPMQTFGFGYSLKDFSRWLDPDPLWIAATICLEVIALSSDNRFDPKFPKACYGIVPFEYPLNLNESPKQSPRDRHILSAKSHDIFDNEMVAFFEKFGPVETSPVLVKGKQISTWHRVRLPKVKCINRSFEIPYICLCGTRGMKNCGIQFGKKIEGSWIGIDETGERHLSLEPTYLLSPDASRRLFSELNFEGRIDPVIDEDSDIARRAAEFISLVRQCQVS